MCQWPEPIAYFRSCCTLRERYNEAVKLARDPDVHNEELIKTFQRSYAGARKVHGGGVV